jgi:serine/threonine-protein kinase
MSATLNRLALVCVPLAAAGLLAYGALPAVQGQDGAPEAKERLAARAQEILKQNCFACHADKPEEVEGNLNLLDRPALEQGKIVVPGKPDASKLFRRITSDKRPMPPKPKARLAPAEIEILKDWIAQGAPSFSDKEVTVKPARLNDLPPAPPEALSARVHGIFKDHCAVCHGGAKPQQFDIEQRDQLLAKGVVVAKDPNASTLFKRITSNDPEEHMPPEGDGRKALTPDEIKAVREWIQQGDLTLESFVAAPPNQIGDEYVLRTILKDVQALSADNQQRLDSFRYVSLNHLLAGGITKAELDYNRQALTLVINHLSRKPEFVVPKAIDPTDTVYRIDISGLGWDDTPYVRREGTEDVPSKVTFYDLLLLDYPYGIIYDGSPTYRQLLTQFLVPTHQVRPVAFLRGDWLVNTAARPPLYNDLLQLPATFFNDKEKGTGGLERQLGLDVQRNIDRDQVVRAGMTVSGVSRNNRTVERHAPKGGTGYLWVSYDYKANTGGENIFQDPVHLKPTGGEMVFRLANGLQGFYVALGNGVRLDAAPVNIVTDQFASDQTVRTGLPCMRCHGSAGLRTFHDNVRSVMEQLASSPSAFDRDEALRLYPPQGKMDRVLAGDQQSFRDAVAKLFGLKAGEEPPRIDTMLDRASKRFLDEPLNLQTAGPELGVTRNPQQIQQVFQNRDLGAAGLIPLASGGTVRRDTWEDLFDQTAEVLQVGVPVVPLDGVNRPDYERPNSPVKLEVKTNRKTFQEKDLLFITVKNTSDQPIFVEAIFTGRKGAKAALTPDVTSLAAGASLRFPSDETQGFQSNAAAGKEFLTVYACDKKFEKGEIVRFPKAETERGFGMAWRVIHRQLFRLPDNGARPRPEFDATRMVKKTIEIESQ